MAHNGNITNAAELSRVERECSIFQANSDTEVILHLVAGRARRLCPALREALLQLEGAFSLVFLAEDRILVARDPHGFRPLAMARWKCPAAAPATFSPGNLRVRPDQCGVSERRRTRRDGHRGSRGDPEAMLPFATTHTAFLSTCIFRARIRSLRAPVRSREKCCRRSLAREHAVDADVVAPAPFLVRGRDGYASESGIPFRHGLIRNHYVGRIFIEPLQAIRDFGVKLKLTGARLA